MVMGLRFSTRVVALFLAGCLVIPLLSAVNVAQARPGRIPKLVLCPMQRAVKDLGWMQLDTVTSSDPTVVTAESNMKHFPSDRGIGGWEYGVVAVAGENNTDEVKTATITLTAHAMRIEKHSLNNIVTIPVEVLPRKRCETAAGLGTANLARGPFAPDFDLSPWRHGKLTVILCIGETLALQATRKENELLLVSSSSDPSVATVAVTDGSINIAALTEGSTVVHLNRAVTDFQPPDGERVPGGTTEMEIHVVVRKCEEPAGEKKVGMIPGYQTSEAYALASHVFSFPQGNIVVNVPTDVRPGETCTGSIIRQPAGATDTEKQANAAVLAAEPIQITSVKEFADEPVKNFTVAMPPGSPEAMIAMGELSKTWGLVTTPMGQMSGMHGQTASGFSCPSQREAFRPMQIAGPFDGQGGNTGVTLGGQPMTVLGETPRGLIVIPPTETAVAGGTQQALVIDENGKHFEQLVTSYPVGQVPRPQVQADQQPVGSMGAAIENICNMTVEAYKENMQAMVDEGWQAPKPPHKGTWTALLEYEINPQGMIQNVRVTQPSGYAPIDASAQARVHSMQGMFRKPPSCATQAIPITHTFKVIYH